MILNFEIVLRLFWNVEYSSVLNGRVGRNKGASGKKLKGWKGKGEKYIKNGIKSIVQWPFYTHHIQMAQTSWPYGTICQEVVSILI